MTSEDLQTQYTEVDNIVDQLERAFEGDAWHGQSMSEILSSVTAAEASAHPIAQAHSIWEIVLHSTAWQRAVRERLQGKPIASLPDAEDWPMVENDSEQAWSEAISRLRAEYEALQKEALRWKNRDLGEITEGQRFTVYQMLHGVIQHNLYHAGQIAILKKAAVAGTQ
jgi:uncharacterized damage-inducible protein DinB